MYVFFVVQIWFWAIVSRYFIYYGEGTKEMAEAIFGASLRDGVCYTTENLSRKQIVPRMIEVLNK